MDTMNIALPESMKHFVQQRVAEGGYSSVSEYVRELIRRDKQRRLGDLEHDLIAAARGPKIEPPVAEIRRKGLVAALRQRTRR